MNEQAALKAIKGMFLNTDAATGLILSKIFASPSKPTTDK